MILTRRSCPNCGTRFTPVCAEQLECGECHIWEGELDDWGAPTYRPRDRAKAPRTAQNAARSLDNYRVVAGLEKKT